MARPRSQAKATEPAKGNTFSEALKFMSFVTKDEGAIYEVYSILHNGWIYAHNGVIGAGHKIDEDIFAAPHNNLLTEAMSKCGQQFSLTQLDGSRLAIKSDKFKCTIPCIDPVTLSSNSYIPDPPTFDINNTFIEALEAVGVLTSETAEHVIAASILMDDTTLVSSNGKIIFECWHGLKLPHGASLPKAIVAPLVKSAKKLSKLGVSNSSVTFHFEDESWLKSQIMAAKWPSNITSVLDKKSNPWPIPIGFWEGVDAVAPFSPNGIVHFETGRLTSHIGNVAGASFEVPGLPKGPSFSVRSLKLIRPFAEQIDFLVEGGRMLYFQGRHIRGMVAGIGH